LSLDALGTLFSESQEAGCEFHCWRLDKIFRAFIETEQRIDLAAQRLVPGAGFSKKSGTLALIEFQSRMV
jgi:hypothetical protein